ncbi:MAG: peptide ABC transporter substrate-binding protein [Anaerolineae bacterium]|nr:peptide ABC transporter substrate-binding protein [Anaerolineae bacterium]
MKRLTIVILLFCAIVPACIPPAVEPVATVPSLPTETPLQTALPIEAPEDAPTPIPPREITICQADEPNTLFVYGGPTRAARNVLEALYDGPVDVRGYQFYPVILDRLPTMANGDVAIGEVSVSAGSKVVNADGAVVDLEAGTIVVDARTNEVEYDDEPISLTQMVVTFTLRADVTWSDGQPVTADDSHFSYELAGQVHNPVLERMRRFTQDYIVVDDTAVVWKGVPGYHEPFYSLYFYQPLPRHAWGTADPDRLLSAEVAQRNPLGWGAFVVEEWVDGQYLTLVRNPHYFRAPEGLPYLDRITFRAVPNLQQALSDLLNGTCDLITQDIIERRVTENGDLVPLLEAADAGKVQLIQSPSSEWEHLDFGIAPAEWVQRPDFFGDVQVRHAVAMCIHRERIAGEAVPYGEASVASSYVAAEHPLYAGDELYQWDYNPSEALALLDGVGWHDEDGDGIREAHGVAGIGDGTPFSITLLTNAGNLAHERTARILQENFSACGIGLSVEYIPDWEFFADGPSGLVFGRQFDLALFSWLNDFQAQCGLYLSQAIPSIDNLWAGTNNPGYASDEFDAACHAALNAIYGTSEYEAYHGEAQRIFSYDLPVVPLYFVPQLVAVRPGVSGVQLDPSQYLELWNVEMFDVSPQSE